MSTTLLISEIFPPKTGGSGRWFWEIYRRMPRESIVIAAGQDSRQAQFDQTHDLRVIRAPLSLREWGIRSLSGLSGYWRALRAVRRVVRTYGVKQLHCGRCLPEGWVGWLMQRRYGLPYVCYVHGEELSYAYSSREIRWLMRRVFRHTDFVVANSHNTERMLTDEWRLAPDRVHVMHPGVDTERFVPADSDDPLRKRLGWGSRPVVLTVGRLQKRKGQDHMIRAIAIIRRSVPDVLYAIVGDGEERASLEGAVLSEGLSEHVRFLGEVDDETLKSCYQQCDLFVLPNRQVGKDIEGFGMVLLEAQACGKPVVAGASGGTAETMRIPETGLVVPCDNPEPIARVVSELLQDPVRRARMGRAAREWVVEHFDWTALSRQAAQIFGLAGESVEPARQSEVVQVAQ